MKSSTALTKLVLYSPKLSTYGRICAIVAAICGVSTELVPTDARSAENIKRHPFARTPSASIDGHAFCETQAICRYLDEAYNDSALQGATPEEKAHCAQWISVANAYVFPTIENGLVLPRLVVPMMGGTPREDIIEVAIPKIAYVMKVLSERLDSSVYFAADRPLMTDLFLFPMIRAAELTPAGSAILDRFLPIQNWLRAMDALTPNKANAVAR